MLGGGGGLVEGTAAPCGGGGHSPGSSSACTAFSAGTEGRPAAVLDAASGGGAHSSLPP